MQVAKKLTHGWYNFYEDTKIMREADAFPWQYVDSHIVAYSKKPGKYLAVLLDQGFSSVSRDTCTIRMVVMFMNYQS